MKQEHGSRSPGFLVYEQCERDEGKAKRVKIRFYREFDPGSGRTLAACLTHASRTELLWNVFGQEVLV